ncbi:NfeD family protein [Limibacillus halophilus]|jgi:membrane protein implicated in regulation of membrane protease activity
MFEFNGIEFWHWWILAVVLAAIEIFAPSFFFLWLGFAAAAVGLVVLVVPNIALEFQLLFFGLFSVVSVVIWLRFVRPAKLEGSVSKLNQRAAQYEGRTTTLEQAIENGVGYVRLDDSRWKVIGPDLPQGTKVKITGADGTVLQVEKA